MSSPFLFCLRKFSSTVINGRGLSPHVIPHLSSTAQSIKGAGHSTSSSINCEFLYRITSARSRLGFNNSYPLVISSTKGHFATGATKPCDRNLKATEAAKSRRWDTWSSARNLRRKQINQHFDLGHVSRILDEILFRGLLGNRMVLRWVEDPMGKLEWLSRTTLISDIKRGPCALIEVKKPLANGPWTLAIIQERLEAALYEMTQVFFLMYSRKCAPFQVSNNQAIIGGVSGHGFSPRSLWREAEQEANRTLKELQRPWRLRYESKDF